MTREELLFILKARDEASAAVQKVKQNMSDLGTTGHKTGGILQTALGTMMGFGGLQALGGVFNFVKSATIGMNAQLETTELQFATLMGSADRAKSHVKDLFEFAKSTPFETQPIIEASKFLQTFGGDALNTKKNLTLVGDASAAVSAPIQELSFWVGRAYSSIQSGKPFGESAMRLQELAVLSPKARDEMEKLQKSGAKASEVWAVMEKDLGRFSGAMGKQANTWSGLMSTLSDTISLSSSKMFAPLFSRAKDALGGVVTLLSDPAVEAAVTSFADGMAKGMDTVADVVGGAIGALQGTVAFFKTAWTEPQEAVNLFQQFMFDAFGMHEDGIPGAVFDGAIHISDFIKGMGDTVGLVMKGDIPGAISTAYNAWTTFRNGVITMITNALPTILDTLNRWGQAAIDWITQIALPGLQVELPKIAAQMLTFLLETLDKVINSLLDFGRAFFKWVGPAIGPMVSELLKLAGTMLKWLGDHSEEIGAKLVEWGLKFGEFIFTVAIPALIQNLPGIIGTIANWAVTEGIPGIVRIFFNLGKGMIGGILDGLGGLKDALWNTLVAAFQAIDIWVGPFHISGRHGISVQMPTITLPTFNLPSFQHGGIVPGVGPQMIMAHGGERITPVGGTGPGGGSISVVVNVGGNVLGVDDLDRQIVSSVREGVRAGGFRGVIPQVSN